MVKWNLISHGAEPRRPFPGPRFRFLLDYQRLWDTLAGRVLSVRMRYLV